MYIPRIKNMTIDLNDNIYMDNISNIKFMNYINFNINRDFMFSNNIIKRFNTYVPMKNSNVDLYNIESVIYVDKYMPSLYYENGLQLPSYMNGNSLYTGESRLYNILIKYALGNFKNKETLEFYKKMKTRFLDKIAYIMRNHPKHMNIYDSIMANSVVFNHIIKTTSVNYKVIAAVLYKLYKFICHISTNELAILIIMKMLDYNNYNTHVVNYFMDIKSESHADEIIENPNINHRLFLYLRYIENTIKVNFSMIYKKYTSPLLKMIYNLQELSLKSIINNEIYHRIMELDKIKVWKYLFPNYIFQSSVSNIYQRGFGLVSKFNENLFYKLNIYNRHELLFKNFDDYYKMALYKDEFTSKSRFKSHKILDPLIFDYKNKSMLNIGKPSDDVSINDNKDVEKLLPIRPEYILI